MLWARGEPSQHPQTPPQPCPPSRTSASRPCGGGFLLPPSTREEKSSALFGSYSRGPHAHCREQGVWRVASDAPRFLAALKGDGGLYSSLPPAKREEVEKLLNGSAGDTWRHLAGELGYQPEHIDSFTREACPVRALLASWAAQDSATLDALLAALRRIQRADIVESLCSESTATSPV